MRRLAARLRDAREGKFVWTETPDQHIGYPQAMSRRDFWVLSIGSTAVAGCVYLLSHFLWGSAVADFATGAAYAAYVVVFFAAKPQVRRRFVDAVREGYEQQRRG